ncbi:MAG TPA: glycosyltransferase family 4 protein [Thermoanaerobaculia bacterium]|nr:glycosyltransferase family 4 protein [Thermoanaerobaculia bacterium]
MKLLVYSPAFLPKIGGLEINVAQFATEMVRLGCEVVVVTETPGEDPDEFSYPVVRHPGARQLLRWTRWCDLYYQANVSLRGLWPLLHVRRPWAVSHHSWYRRGDGRIAWQDRLKRFLLRFAAISISVSQGIANDLETPSIVIPNPYRDHLFRILPDEPRERDLVFLGRLVSDKGVDVLIEALRHLADRGLRPALTIIGAGPEAPRLAEQAVRSGLGEQVELLGARTGEELVRRLNRHRILVVPSRYNEPFGIVALEGIACGCAVVGSRGGGLPEAIGPCGRTFRNGDAEHLAAVLAEVLADPAQQKTFQEQAPRHLAEHASERIARLYFEALSGGMA